MDIRGTAREVIERMDLVTQVGQARIGARGMAFVDESGRRVASLGTDVFGPSGGPVAEWALLRTDLARILYDAISDDVPIVFDDAITAMEYDKEGVAVTFENGEPRRFDLVVGADGVRSTVRRLRFGPDGHYVRDLDSYIALFSHASHVELNGWQVMHTVPGRNGRNGRTAGLRPMAQHGRALAGFFFRVPGLVHDRRDVTTQKQIVVDTFADVGWEVPAILEKIWDATDFYFDRVEQVRLDTWWNHRTVLVGDSAYCASPMSGIGTSLALVGAHVLASELARASGDHRAGFAGYQAVMQPFVDRAQQFARTSGDGGLMPASSRQLWLRNQSVRLVRHLPKRVVARGLEQISHTVTLDALGARNPALDQG